MQAGALPAVGGVDVGALVLPAVQLGSGPRQQDLEGLGPPPLVFIRPGEPGVRGPLRGQDLGPHAEQVQGRLIVHVTLVRVPIFTEEERPRRTRRRQRRVSNLLLIGPEMSVC